MSHWGEFVDTMHMLSSEGGHELAERLAAQAALGEPAGEV